MWADRFRPGTRRLSLVVALTLASGSACLARSDVMLAQGQEPVIRVTEQDNAREVIVPHGGLLSVTLPSVPGTGYSWRLLEFDKAALELLKQSSGSGPKGAPGAAEQQIFLFRALAVGSTPLKLGYARPWEKTKVPAKQYAVTVDVR